MPTFFTISSERIDYQRETVFEKPFIFLVISQCITSLIVIFDLFYFHVQGSERTLNVVDIREGFYFNPDMENNQLPDERELPGFADVIVAYSKQLNQLG